MDTETLDLIRPSQAAKMLGITVETLRHWRCSGKHFTKCVKIGGQHRFDRQEVLEYREQGRINYRKSLKA